MANTPSEFMTNNMIIAPPLPGRYLYFRGCNYWTFNPFSRH